ncbi:MAG: hypothetical protein ABEJ98_05830 [Candidatus Nanohaloarchaea archaeon]
MRCILFAALAVLMFSSASATEVESGYFKASSTGTITEDVGFRPDYIEFITAQQIEQKNFHQTDPQNNDCPDNVNGWAEGSVLFDSAGTTSSDVRKQFSIGIFRNSDSTNGHRIASSTSDAIKNLYVSQNANLCGGRHPERVRHIRRSSAVQGLPVPGQHELRRGHG